MIGTAVHLQRPLSIHLKDMTTLAAVLREKRRQQRWSGIRIEKDSCGLPAVHQATIFPTLQYHPMLSPENAQGYVCNCSLPIS